MADETNAPEHHKWWSKVINGWKGKARSERTTWNEYSAMYRTMAHPRNRGEQVYGVELEDSTSVESNWAFAFADTLAANVVPTNPAVTIRANRAKNDQYAKLRTQLANTIFRKERLHQKLWAMAIRASVWPRCWIKCVWNEALNRPILRVINPHYVFFDTTAESEEDMKYIIEVTVLSRGEFMRRVKKKGKKGGAYRHDCVDQVDFGKWPQWVDPEDAWSGRDQDIEAKLVRDTYEWTTVFEVYDLVGKKFYHFADGVDEALLEDKLPYKHLSNPYKALIFNDNLHDLGGMSDVELIKPTVDRLNELDTLQMTHLKTSIPSPVVHEGLLDDPGSFLDAYLAVDGPGQPISLHARPNVGVNDVIGVTPMPTLPVEWSRARGDLESIVQLVLALPSYSRGAVGQSDVATELALTDTATRTRNARRQKAIYDIIEWVAGAVVSLYQEYMDPNSTIPIRVMDTEEETELTRELLDFSDDADDPWAWDYQAHPYTAAEANDVVQLKQMETYMPVLLQGMQVGIIDPRKMFKKMLELLHMPDLLSEAGPNTPAPAPMDPTAPGQPGGAPLPAGPGGMSGMMPTAAQGPMQGGDVNVGSGDQQIAAAIAGGNQPGGGGF